MIEYVETAIAAGLQEIGFADHLGRYYLSAQQRRRYWDWGMDRKNLGRYVAELLDLKDAFQDQIRIKIGLEVDYIEGAEDLVAPIVAEYPFDYLLGSIHCLPGLGWRHLSTVSKAFDSALIYEEYFRAARSALRCGLFSALAHPDFVWRYIDWPRRDPELPLREIAETVRTAAETHGVMEINSNGFLWSKENKPEWGNPFDTLIEEIRNRGVPVSLGSDAHEPLLVAKLFPELIEILHDKGIRTFVCFSEGKPRVETLEKSGNAGFTASTQGTDTGKNR